MLSLRQISSDHNPTGSRAPRPTAGPVVASVLTGDRGGAFRPARSLYIHVPFCAHKCHYCDFYSIVDRRDRQAAFTDRLVRELAALAPLAGGLPLRTVFVGGGTPSLLEPALWERLLCALREHYDLSGLSGESPGCEFTVECNPESTTDELMGVLAAGGVNRVSVGAQSFDPHHLRTLERWHDPENVARALERARDHGIARRSLDLIFGVPGQTPAEWDRDLDRALALPIDHLSAYCLTYEPGTAMTARLERGQFAPAAESDEIAMLERTLERVRGAGFDRYEVSNYACPGRECRHNLAYWRQEPWIGAGPSASAHVGGHRWTNTPRLDDYLNILSIADDGFAPISDHEPPDPARALRERLMTGLRLREGLDAEHVLSDAASLDPVLNEHTLPDRLRTIAGEQAARGRLDADALGSGLWSLTEAGMLFADGVAWAFMEAVPDAASG